MMTVIYITQSSGTEQDIFLAPAAYWEHFLHPRLDDFWRKKNRSVRSEDAIPKFLRGLASTFLISKYPDLGPCLKNRWQ
jgi:hypothetical protein